jgi:hypothetical protein
MNITSEQFKVLISKGYSLDVLFILKMIDEGQDISSLTENKKIELLYHTLVRKGLITEDNKVTLEGRSLLGFLSTSEVVIQKRKPVADDGFTKWWSTYPGTDTFTHKGRTFSGTRGLRVKKDDCKLLLTKIVGEGEYTIDELIKALEIEVTQKKDNSVKTSTNKLTYMQNSLTYLNQRTFEPFIELARKAIPIEESVIGGTDI